ncbi:MAG: hypothetical protein Tsb002_33400 [Wenzhouxiangellaceae bacterium]
MLWIVTIANEAIPFYAESEHELRRQLDAALASTGESYRIEPGIDISAQIAQSSILIRRQSWLY